MNRCLILVWILVWPAFFASAQDKDSVALFGNGGVVTYLNKNPQANFAVSFKGDTIYDTGLRSGNGMSFVVDSAFVQVTKFGIPMNRIEDKFNTKKERALLDDIRKSALEHLQSDLYRSPLKNESMFFENSWGKQFQLGEYEIPLADRHSGDVGETHPVMYMRKEATHNLSLSFVANNHVIMIGMPVLEHESKEVKIALLKEQIANSIKIFPAPVMEEELREQLSYHKSGKEIDVKDSIEGINFVIPYWLNMMQGPNYLQGVFPDINNISNAMIIILVDKSNYASFEDFKSQGFKRRDGRNQSPKMIKSDNNKLSKYSFHDNTPYGRFQGQKVFFEGKKSYGVINFTATDDTFDKNIARFEEFLSKVEIESF